MNGEDITFVNDPKNMGSLIAAWDTTKKTFQFSGFGDARSLRIWIADSSGPHTGDHVLDKLFYPNSGRYTEYNTPQTDYDTDSTHNGYLHLTYDAGGGRISGTFSFIGLATPSGKVATVSDGSFSMPCRIE